MKSKTSGKLDAIPRDVVDLIDYQANAIVSREILKSKSGTVTIFAFDAGQGLSEHTAPFDALVQVLDGEVEITVADNAHTVKAGQLLIIPAQKPHELKTNKRFKMLLVMIRS